MLADIEAGKIDCVVVYKLDRLTRSLLDFTKLIEIFDRHHVSFVSVTQHFDTSTSMGRLMLNILLSFAQFEREIIGERIRDKVAATRRKGKYTGGPPVLGYGVDRERKRLVVNPEEAELVRRIFSDFVRTGSTTTLAQRLNEEGHTTKSWTTKGGRHRPGTPWNKVLVYRVLNNPLYLGEVTHRGERYPGEHAPIVGRDLSGPSSQHPRAELPRPRGEDPREDPRLVARSHQIRALPLQHGPELHDAAGQGVPLLPMRSRLEARSRVLSGGHGAGRGGRARGDRATESRF